MQIHKHARNGARVARIHREALTRPVAGASQPLELLDDDAPLCRFPVPDQFQEFLAPQVMPRLPLLLAQLPLHHRLRGDARVIRTRQPEHLVPQHSRPARQHILDRIIEHMPQRQHTGHIRRRDDDGVGRLGRCRVRGESAVRQPAGIPFFLYGLGLVRFGDLCHGGFGNSDVRRRIRAPECRERGAFVNWRPRRLQF